MKRLSVLIGAVLLVTLSACGGGSSAGSAGSSAAPASSQAPPAQATAAATAVDNGAPGALPIYPNAVKSTVQLSTTMTSCGHKITMTMYHVANANADTIGDWYSGQIPGSSEMKGDIAVATRSIHHVMVMKADGTAAASIVDMPKLPPSMAKYAAKMGAIGGTQLALATYDPGFTSDDVALFKAAFYGSGAAKADATAKLKAKCGNDFKFGG